MPYHRRTASEDAPPLYRASGGARAVRRVLPARPEAVAQARHEVSRLPISQDGRADLVVLVSELVSNAVRHGGTRDPVRLKISTRAGRARIEVRDGGPGFDPPRASDPVIGSGRGLELVAAVSERWGVVRSGRGCTVWCEVVVEEPARTMEQDGTEAYINDLAAGAVASRRRAIVTPPRRTVGR